MAAATSKKPRYSLLLLLRDVHGGVCLLGVLLCLALYSQNAVPALDKYVWLSNLDEAGNAAHPPTSWSNTLYKHHTDDWCFVLFWAFGLTALRVLIQGGPLSWLAALMGCPKKNLHKFKEVGWQVIYYVTAWLAGVYIAIFSEEAWVSFYREEGGWMYWVDQSRWWADYPFQPLSGRLKAYYLLQLAFWIHMVFVTAIEEWRKDFWMMMVHHAVTIFLLSASFFGRFQRSGSVVLLTLDVADCLLPLAKLMRYCGYRLSADIVFGWFTVVWIVTRHFMYWLPVWSLTFRAPLDIKVDWDPSIGSYYSRKWTYVMYWAAFLILQGLLLCWLRLLLIAVHKALVVGHIEDHRSDSDDDGEVSATPAAVKRIRAPQKPQPTMDVSTLPVELQSPQISATPMVPRVAATPVPMRSAVDTDDGNEADVDTPAPDAATPQQANGVAAGGTPSAAESGGVRRRGRRVD